MKFRRFNEISMKNWNFDEKLSMKNWISMKIVDEQLNFDEIIFLM